MRTVKSMLKLMWVAILVLGFAVPSSAFWGDKFEKEVEKETGAVKLVREIQRGGYDVVTTEELKNWINSGKEMIIAAQKLDKILLRFTVGFCVIPLHHFRNRK